MGTASSRNSAAAATDDQIEQCKKRRGLMKEALRRRRQLASSHAAYLRTLRRVASDLTRFADSQPLPLDEDDTERDGGEEQHGSVVEVAARLTEGFLNVSSAGDEVSGLLEASGAEPNARGSRACRRALFCLSAPAVAQDRSIESLHGAPRHSTTLLQILARESRLGMELKDKQRQQARHDSKSAVLARQRHAGEEISAVDEQKLSAAATELGAASKAAARTSSDIAELRDKHLDRQLRLLRRRTLAMWEAMREHHGAQSQAAEQLRGLRSATSEARTTTEKVHPDPKATRALQKGMAAWRKALGDVASHQRDYLRALHGWLELTLALPDGRSDAAANLAAFVEGWREKLADVDCAKVSGPFDRFSATMGTLHERQIKELRREDGAKKCSRDLALKSERLLKAKSSYDSRLLAGSGRRRRALDAEAAKKGIEECRRRVGEKNKSHAESVEATRVAAVAAIRTLPAVFQAMAKFPESLDQNAV